MTDHYRVDRSFGTNEQFRDLVAECHKRNIKVVRDVVLNHIGDNHYWMKDLPTKDWVNQWPTYTKPNYRAPALLDPYASEYDKILFSDGWFDLEFYMGMVSPPADAGWHMTAFNAAVASLTFSEGVQEVPR